MEKEEKNVESAVGGGRLAAIDALRGFDMFWIMGGENVFLALAAATSCPFFASIAEQMHHVAWDGFHFMDLVFPLFVFLAGASFAFSYAKSESKGVPRGKILLKILSRTAVLILFGILYNEFTRVGFARARFPSVLARIGLAWGAAAALWTLFPRRWKIHAAFLGIILGVWYGATLCVGAETRWTIDGNAGSVIDRFVFGNHIYVKGRYDPEGILSTLPAVLNGYFGLVAGEALRKLRERGGCHWKTLAGLLCGAAVSFSVAAVLSLLCSIPVNKALWTPSFVGVTVGCSLLLLALFYLLADVMKLRKTLFFFTVIGMNPITIYLLQQISNSGWCSNGCSRGLWNVTDFFFGAIMSACSPEWAKVVQACGYVLVCWLILLFFYRKKIFLKV